MWRPAGWCEPGDKGSANQSGRILKMAFHLAAAVVVLLDPGPEAPQVLSGDKRWLKPGGSLSSKCQTRCQCNIAIGRMVADAVLPGSAPAQGLRQPALAVEHEVRCGHAPLVVQLGQFSGCFEWWACTAAA